MTPSTAFEFNSNMFPYTGRDAVSEEPYLFYFVARQLFRLESVDAVVNALVTCTVSRNFRSVRSTTCFFLLRRCVPPPIFLSARRQVRVLALAGILSISVSTGNPGFAASDPSTGLTAPHLNLSIGDKTQYYFYTYDHHAIVSSDAVEPLLSFNAQSASSVLKSGTKSEMPQPQLSGRMTLLKQGNRTKVFAARVAMPLEVIYFPQCGINSHIRQWHSTNREYM